MCSISPHGHRLVFVQHSFLPARVIMQDFSGLPEVVDLAAMRTAIARLGGNPESINPLVPVDLVIDHSVQVDFFANADALQRNTEMEFQRNHERYEFIKWGQKVFSNFRVVPPMTGIVHQVNLEYLAQVVSTREVDGEWFAFPDTVVGTNSHTTMINGLGVVGWGVGGIEAEAVMLGQPMDMLLPDVIGFKLSGKLKEGVTATDLVLTVTQILRKHGVVDKFVEFFGPGLNNMSLPDRALVSNMSPEYGALLRYILEDFEKKEHLKRGYQFVIGPQILKVDLWKKSGHYENYRENMYFTKVDDVEYGLKPMNCVAHIMVYKSQIRSYRDLPLRYFELGTVNRHELSGVLHGLMRVREFTQDDAHIFCRQDQLHDEINGIVSFVADVMSIFGFDYELEISTRPKEHFIGRLEDWDKAESILKAVLDDRSIPYDINEGDGAFYGPKIDVKLKDALGRKWQCATIQLDFALPERFDLHYTDKDSLRKRPVMLHRVILGAMERFIGILIEHYAGRFPLWLSPLQVLILTITDEQAAYAEELRQTLAAADIRVEIDGRNEKLGFKIREGTMRKVPYMLILGRKEVETRTISVRGRDGAEMKGVTAAEFIERAKGREYVQEVNS